MIAVPSRQETGESMAVKSYSASGQPWHAVSVVSGVERCTAASALRQKRFLSIEAPRLPLADCTMPAACQCRYQHHPDRRVGMRRETDRGGLPYPWQGPELRRNPLGRRASDKP
jgi:hypothetical protein